MRTHKLKEGKFHSVNCQISGLFTNNSLDLPGHQDEVYAVDWSPDGQKVCSGGKDKAVRVWRH